jgi:hypothetical protein
MNQNMVEVFILIKVERQNVSMLVRISKWVSLFIASSQCRTIFSKLTEECSDKLPMEDFRQW